MPYYWKAYNYILAEFETEQDAKEALDFDRGVLVSLPNGEEFECKADDINIIHEDTPIDFPVDE